MSTCIHKSTLEIQSWSRSTRMFGGHENRVVYPVLPPKQTKSRISVSLFPGSYSRTLENIPNGPGFPVLGSDHICECLPNVVSDSRISNLEDITHRVTLYLLYTSLCTGELNAIRKHKCFLCSPFYVKGVSLGYVGRIKT